MRRALTLARRGWGWTAPNPMVGCVLVRDGANVGEGWHGEFGGAHAEIAALNAAGERARGATAYVTLEPCDHTGKTPPCTRALVAAGVARVVFAATDPDPAAGGGAGRLRGAGIVVDSGLCADDATALNPAFHSRFARSRPFITLKLAVSLDGAIAPASGSAWLTGPQSVRAVHRMRSGHDAIAVGSGTAIADDPLLTVRGVRAPRVPPVRIVFDRRARLASRSRLVRSVRRAPVYLVTADPPPAAAHALAAAGVTLVPATTLGGALTRLAELGVDAILCEGGARLAGSLLTEGCVDRLVIFHTPVLLGAGAVGAVAFPDGVPRDEVQRWKPLAHTVLGDDVQSVYAPHR